MGTWGPGSFENDEALDWLTHLEEQGAPLLHESLSVETTADYVDATDGTFVIAAAEAVAALIGKPGDNLPEKLTAWVSSERGRLDAGEYQSKALALLQRVKGERSELHELWAENEEGLPRWRAVVDELIQRLLPR